MPKKSLLLLMPLCFFSVAQAIVIDFDDITSDSLAALNGVYSGLNFGNGQVGVISDDFYQIDYNNSYGSTSGNYSMFNWSGVQTVTITSGTFDFNGASVSSFAYDDSFVWFSSQTVTFEGYFNSVLVQSAQFDLSADQFDWFQVELLGIDELRILNDGLWGQWWLIDDLTINETASVPDTGQSIALLGLALIGLVGLRKSASRK